MLPEELQDGFGDGTPISEVGEGIFRIERKSGDVTFAVYFVVYERPFVDGAFDIHEYQKILLGKEYYDNAGSLQWNYYIVFVWTESDRDDSNIESRCAEIERDLIFARKYFVTRDKLRELIAPKVLRRDGLNTRDEILTRGWSDAVTAAGLSELLLPNANVNQAVREYMESDAVETSIVDSVDIPFENAFPEALRQPKGFFIHDLYIDRYRKTFPPKDRHYTFGTVNLITGVNASGKTSLLEAIEYWCCGRNSRSSGEEAGVPWRIGAKPSSSSDPIWTDELETSDLRRRELIWYGSHSPRVTKVEAGFARYNFFNTDAAIDFSNDSRRADIRAPLAALVLGEYAAIVERQLNRARDVLQQDFDTSESFLEQATERRNSAATTLDTLRANKTEMPVLKSRLFEALQRVKWTGSAITEEVLSAVTVVDRLTFARSALTHLANNSSWVDCRDLGTAVSTLDRVISAGDAYREINVKARVYITQAEDLSRKITNTANRLASVQRYIVYRDSKAIERLRNSEQAKAQNTAIVGKLGAQLLAAQTILGSAWLSRSVKSSVPLLKYRADVSEKIRNARKARGELADAMEQARKKLNTARRVLLELREHAQHLLSLSDGIEDCPVCGQHYGAEELRIRIQNAANKDPQLDKGEPSAIELEKLDEIIGQLVQDDISCTDAIAAAAFDPVYQSKTDTYGIEELSQYLGSVQDGYRVAESVLKSADDQLKELSRQGYSNDELAQLRASLADAHAQFDNVSWDPIPQMKRELDELYKQFGDINAARSNCERESERIVAEALGNSAQGNQVQLFHERITTAKLVKEELSAMAADLSVTGTLESALVSIDDAIGLAEEFRVRLLSESDGTVIRESQKLVFDEADAEVKKLALRRAKAGAGVNAINSAFAKFSKEDYLAQFFANNHATMQELFSQIHAPREFSEIAVDSAEESSVSLIRRTGEIASLSQISTGQRAALALSVFLTLNSNVDQGPHLILLDDPISHVDDMNVLSFFDFLRELSIRGHRQIFFATANARMASLFIRKMDFLGDEFKLIELERTESKLAAGALG